MLTVVTQGQGYGSFCRIDWFGRDTVQCSIILMLPKVKVLTFKMGAVRCSIILMLPKVKVLTFKMGAVRCFIMLTLPKAETYNNYYKSLPNVNVLTV